MCLDKIYDSILSIREDLKNIKQVLLKHNEIYFKHFRKIYNDGNIISLKMHIDQFNIRMKMLIDIITVYNVKKLV